MQSCLRDLRFHSQGIDDEVGVRHGDGPRGRPRRHAPELGTVISCQDRALTLEYVESTTSCNRLSAASQSRRARRPGEQNITYDGQQVTALKESFPWHAEV